MIERLPLPVSESDLEGLARLLANTVNGGAAIHFLAPLSPEQTREWWRRTLASSPSTAIFLVARDAEGIVGTVQLQPATAPNQPHRAEVAKLMVHPRSRRGGLGEKLMHAIEDAAREAGFTLLTLDTRSGDTAERLYDRLGWKAVGTIPRFALNSDKSFHSATIFYKDLNPTQGS
jgi:GNAT superfamily N-acetyltransferase